MLKMKGRDLNEMIRNLGYNCISLELEVVLGASDFVGNDMYYDISELIEFYKLDKLLSEGKISEESFNEGVEELSHDYRDDDLEDSYEMLSSYIFYNEEEGEYYIDYFEVGADAILRKSSECLGDDWCNARNLDWDSEKENWGEYEYCEQIIDLISSFVNQIKDVYKANDNKELNDDEVYTFSYEVKVTEDELDDFWNALCEYDSKDMFGWLFVKSMIDESSYADFIEDNSDKPKTDEMER